LRAARQGLSLVDPRMHQGLRLVRRLGGSATLEGEKAQERDVITDHAAARALEPEVLPDAA